MVYIDNYYAQVGRKKLSHMIADTKEELLAMVRRLKMSEDWIQNEDTPKEHFDIAKGKRMLAIKLGAKEISCKELVKIINNRRAK